MTQVDDLRICFVLPNNISAEKECSSDMKLASELVATNGGCVKWIKSSDCYDIVPQKKDVFVFDKFEGSAFEALKQNSAKYVYVFNLYLSMCII